MVIASTPEMWVKFPPPATHCEFRFIGQGTKSIFKALAYAVGEKVLFKHYISFFRPGFSQFFLIFHSWFEPLSKGERGSVHNAWKPENPHSPFLIPQYHYEKKIQ